MRMARKIFIIVFVTLAFFLPSNVSAEIAPEIQWSRNVGGNLEEIAYDIVQTSDGGYIVAGMKYIVNTFEDIYVIKFSESGDVEWEKNYENSKKDFANSIMQAKDGGYIICGGTFSNTEGVSDYYIIKLDSAGNVQWERKFGDIQGEICEAVIQTMDGGYMAAGGKWLNLYDRDMYLVKLDADGNLEWEKLIDGGNDDGAYDIQQTPDRGYIIAGYTRSLVDGDYNMFIVRTDSHGDTKWKSDFGGSGSDQAYSIEQHRNGYIAAGYTKSYNEFSDVYVVDLNLDGEMVWEKSYGIDDTQEEARSIKNTADGGFILAGRTNQYAYGSFDAYLLKLDRDGNELWSQVFGGQNSDMGYAVLQSQDGGYVIAGQTKSYGSAGDVYIVKTEGQAGSMTGRRVDIPEYGSPANGVIFTFIMLIIAGLMMKRKK